MPSDDRKDAWGYVRLSQEGRDKSIDGQKEAIREYTARREDLSLVTTRNDGITSGFDADRDEYQILRRNIRDGDVDAIVVRDRARLSRDFDERAGLLIELRSTETELHVIEAGGRVRIEDVETAAMECIHAMTDHIKKKAEIRRAKAAMQERRDADAYQGGEPFGLTFGANGRYLVPDEGEFEDALEAIQMREDGVSQRAVADEIGASRDTVRKMMDRTEWYFAAEQGIPIGRDGPVEELPDRLLATES